MSGVRFWRRAANGEEIPLERWIDPCLPLFEMPARFGLHDEMLDEVRALRRDEADRVLVSLAVANGWVLVEGAPETMPPRVIAPGETAARTATRRLQLHRQLPELRIETIDGALRAGRAVALIRGQDVQRFVDGTPVSALTPESWSEGCGPRLGNVPSSKRSLVEVFQLLFGKTR